MSIGKRPDDASANEQRVAEVPRTLKSLSPEEILARASSSDEFMNSMRSCIPSRLFDATGNDLDLLAKVDIKVQVPPTHLWTDDEYDVFLDKGDLPTRG